MSAALEKVAETVRCPKGGDKVYKDECIYCFDSPESERGLYICLKTWFGIGEAHLARHRQRTGSCLYLHLKTSKRELPEEEKEKTAVTKMAIGVEGGFDGAGKKYETTERNQLVLLGEGSERTVFELTDKNIPAKIQEVVAAVLAADSAAKQEELAAMAGTWDGEMRVVSKHAANLLQLDPAGKKIPPSGWKCERCDLTTNLWLNLTDGSILCGRKFFDGSGGNNHAVDHYAESKYPLAVKLGTISSDGQADVFSYDEDDMVQDPNLAVHLAHWGINISKLQKTDKTMAELEIDLNQRVQEWDVIQESAEKLETAYGPGRTGMKNLGNSCYMNSVLQVLMNIPDFRQRYFDNYERNISANCDNPATDFNIQMSKVAHGLLSGLYSEPVTKPATEIVECRGTRPQMFKSLVGAGHVEFSTKRQQDAAEFLLHLLNLVERTSAGGPNPVDAFRFTSEQRWQCGTSGAVRYVPAEELVLEVPVDEQDMDNKDAVMKYRAMKEQADAEKKPLDPSTLVRPHIPLSRCLERLAADETVTDFYSSAINAKTTATKRFRLTSCPDFLILKLRKFTISADWSPTKLDVEVGMPAELDLSWMRAPSGLQPGETQLPEETAPQQPAFEFNEAIVSQLAEMGFALEGCKRAVFHTNNSGVEQAMEWVMQHMGDPDFEYPFEPPSARQPSGAGAEDSPPEDCIQMCMALGVTRPQAIKALRATSNSVERAADWIFSHADELATADDTQQTLPAKNTRDGSAKYRLRAFISHMGSSCMVGHYVCHVLVNNQWLIFNDEKVALSKKPPIDLGYVYFYERI